MKQLFMFRFAELLHSYYKNIDFQINITIFLFQVGPHPICWLECIIISPILATLHQLVQMVKTLVELVLYIDPKFNCIFSGI